MRRPVCLCRRVPVSFSASCRMLLRVVVVMPLYARFDIWASTPTLARQEHQRCEQYALQADAEQRRVASWLYLRAARQAHGLRGRPRRVIRRPAPSRRLGEHVLSPAPGNLDAQTRLVRARVCEGMCDAGCNLHDVLGARCSLAQPDLDSHEAVDDSKRWVWIRWTSGTGTAPPGRRAKSKASSSPSVLVAV